MSLPEELQAALDKRISMGMAGDLNKYTQYQTANAIPLAAQNEGGIAGIGAGLASGMAIGQQMAQGLASGLNGANNSTQRGDDAAADRRGAPCRTRRRRRRASRKLKGLLDKGLISQVDFDGAKARRSSGGSSADVAPMEDVRTRSRPQPPDRARASAEADRRNRDEHDRLPLTCTARRSRSARPRR